MPNDKQENKEVTPPNGRDALMLRMGVKASEVRQVEVSTAKKGKETKDTPLQKLTRSQMHNAFKGNCKLIQSATYFEPIPERVTEDKKVTIKGKLITIRKGKILRDSEGVNVVDYYLPRPLSGEFVCEDNGDGTHTATRFNVFKEVYTISDLVLTQVTNHEINGK